MKNDIGEKYGSTMGRYERSSNVNGIPSYKMASGEFAIWYSTSRSWIIGLIKDIGSNTGNIFVKKGFGRFFHKRNVWSYFNDNQWKTTGTNDVTVICISGTIMFLQNSFPFKYWFNYSGLLEPGGQWG